MFCEILKKYENINTSFGTDKNTTHSYGNIYENKFEKYKHSASKILEIGFDSGASLQVYSEYFKNDVEEGVRTYLLNEVIPNSPRFLLPYNVSINAMNDHNFIMAMYNYLTNFI